ncbi:MAG: hypothetical protein C4583_12055 [Anaerolineaceae bacterium]|nr:MAG: hypothetical protein C4583_12055 [Anaerolineaceae bacterium]
MSDDERFGMTHLKLDDAFVDDALEFLKLRRQQPTFEYLNVLIDAFIHRIPWESVFRIIKRDATPATADCPRFPQEVWSDAMKFSGGGTCFEINYAFFALLRALGYKGYMTLNDMSEARACHAAIVLLFNGQKYLVDVSVPLPRAFAYYPDSTVHLYTPWLKFTIQPRGENRYEVMRAPHARPYIFTFNDAPISVENFEAAIEADYLSSGWFLNRVVINKMLGETAWLFNSDTRPYMLESFDHDGKHEIPLDPETLAESLAERFQIPAKKSPRRYRWWRR